MLESRDARILEFIYFLMSVYAVSLKVCFFDNRDLPNMHALRAQHGRCPIEVQISSVFQFSGSVARSPQAAFQNNACT